MLLGLLAVLMILLISTWTIARDTGNRLISCGISIAIFIPFEIFNTSFPELPLSKISPFAMYCSCVFFLYIFKSIYLRKNLIFDRTMFTGFIYLAFVAGTTYFNLGGKGFGTFIDNYLAPSMALFILVNERRHLKTTLRNRYLVIISIAAAYGTLEFILKQNILYGFIFSQMGWVNTQWNSSFHRSTSTIGHPLIAATVYVITLAFLDKSHKRYWFYFTIIGMGVLSTGSRAGVAMMVLIILAKHLRLQQSQRNVVALSTICVFVTLGYFTGLFDQLIHRFANGEGSNTVRLQLLDYISEILKISMWGYGVGSSGDVALNIGFYNVIEIAWVALLIELGIWGLVATFLVALMIIKSYRLRDGRTLFLISLFLMISSYNSISVHTPLTFLAVLILFIPKSKTLENKHGKSFRNNINPTKIQVPTRPIISSR